MNNATKEYYKSNFHLYSICGILNAGTSPAIAKVFTPNTSANDNYGNEASIIIKNMLPFPSYDDIISLIKKEGCNLKDIVTIDNVVNVESSYKSGITIKNKKIDGSFTNVLLTPYIVDWGNVEQSKRCENVLLFNLEYIKYAI